MIKKTKGRRIRIVLFTSIFACFFLFTSASAGARQEKHIVQKGDTLWSICEKYYGNPNLWPKLWQMNPFVTNPHLLKPGDEITLLDDESLKKAEPGKKPAAEPGKVAPVMKGIDLSDRINLEALGYLSLLEVEPLGVIESSPGTRKILTSGDKAFVHFGGKAVKPGDTFSIAERSDLIRHPLTGKPLGYVVTTKGALSVKEHLQKGIYLAEVTRNFSEIYIGDLVMPPNTKTTCLRPVATDTRLYGNVVATHGNRKLVGRGTIIYLDSGYKDGVQTGALFDLVRINKLPAIDTKHDSFEVISNEILGTLSKAQYLEAFWKKIQEGKTLYESSVGKVIILDSRPDTSLGFVLSCNEDLEVGAFVKGMSWVEPPDVLTTLPSCAFQ